MLSALFVPCGICGFLLGVYNYERFGSWTEFGINYSLQGVNPKVYTLFDLHRLAYGLAYYLIVPAKVMSRFPFATLAPHESLTPPPYLFLEPVAGILATTPIW